MKQRHRVNFVQKSQQSDIYLLYNKSFLSFCLQIKLLMNKKYRSRLH